MVIFPEKQITCCTLQALDCIMELILPFYTFSFYIFFNNYYVDVHNWFSIIQLSFLVSNINVCLWRSVSFPLKYLEVRQG